MFGTGVETFVKERVEWSQGVDRRVRLRQRTRFRASVLNYLYRVLRRRIYLYFQRPREDMTSKIRQMKRDLVKCDKVFFFFSRE